MRILLTIVAIQLLTLPFLKIIGAVLLVYIGVDLLKGGGDDEGHGKEIDGMGTAIRTILVADLVMSLDNVLAVAAAAKGNIPLLVLGLLAQYSAHRVWCNFADQGDGTVSDHHYHWRSSIGLLGGRDAAD